MGEAFLYNLGLIGLNNISLENTWTGSQGSSQGYTVSVPDAIYKLVSFMLMQDQTTYAYFSCCAIVYKNSLLSVQRLFNTWNHANISYSDDVFTTSGIGSQPSIYSVAVFNV